MTSRNAIAGINSGYVLELYDRYQQDPSSVDSAAREFFATWTPPSSTNGTAPQPAAEVTALAIDKIVGAVNYAQSIRDYGHLARAA